MKPADGGTLQVAVSKDDIKAATGDSSADPRGMAIGGDGMSYNVNADTMSGAIAAARPGSSKYRASK